MISSELEALRKSEHVKDMLERWSVEDFHEYFDATIPFESDHLNIHLILKLFLESKVTKRTKKIMKIILQAGADPMYKIPNGSRLAGIAFKQSDCGVALIFLDHLRYINSAVDRYKNTALHLSIEKQDFAFFHSVLLRKPDLNIKNGKGDTALHRAVYFRQFHKIESLIKAGADVNREDKYGQTVAHHVVATEGKCLKFLILNVADVKAKDIYGNTPLHMFLECPKTEAKELCKILFDRGADPNEPNNIGMTPFHNLVGLNWRYTTSECNQFCDMFIKHGARINSQNSCNGWSVLHMFAKSDGWWQEKDDFLVRLIQSGADANILTHDGSSIIDFYTGNSKSIRVLIKHLNIEAFKGNFQFGQLLSSQIRSDQRYQNYFDSCRKELDSLVSIKFKNSFRLFDVLVETNNRKLACYCRNEEYINKMIAFDICRFPIYGDDLKMKFEEGLKIFEAEVHGYPFFSIAFRGKLNYDCIETIMQYFSPKELRNLGNILKDT